MPNSKKRAITTVIPNTMMRLASFGDFILFSNGKIYIGRKKTETHSGTFVKLYVYICTLHFIHIILLCTLIKLNI